jgi:hypothetical protein
MCCANVKGDRLPEKMVLRLQPSFPTRSPGWCTHCNSSKSYGSSILIWNVPRAMQRYVAVPGLVPPTDTHGSAEGRRWPSMQCLPGHSALLVVFSHPSHPSVGDAPHYIAPPQEKWHNSKIFNFQIMWSFYVIWKLKILELCQFYCGGSIWSISIDLHIEQHAATDWTMFYQ